MGHKFFPVLLARVRHGRGHNAKVFSSLVGTNIEEVSAMTDVVLVVRLSRQNRLPVRVCSSCRNETNFSRSLAEDFEKDYSLIAGTPDSDVKQLVLFFIQKIRLVASKRVSIHLVACLVTGSSVT